MAYIIKRTDGTTLTTIQDGTINTTSTSLGLPGRNYAGYGNILNINMVRVLENSANSSPPSHPLRGQLWYDTSTAGGVLKVCPADGTTNSSAWYSIVSTATGGAATFSDVVVTGNITANNAAIAHELSADTLTVRLANVTGKLTTANANMTAATIGTTTTAIITTGGTTTAGSLTGSWTLSGNSAANALAVSTGDIAFTANSVNGIKCDNYMYANGFPFTPSGTYGNANVAGYLPTYAGNITATKITVSAIAGGGNISGVWTLAAGATMQATYADLAERYEADAAYAPGTVVEIGGEKEVTAVVSDLSEDVFGVVSNTAAYLMNATAGSDETHPPIALSGRVTVNVTGRINKGDRLVSAGNGLARAAIKSELTAFNSIGRALANKSDEGVGTVLAVVMVAR